VRREGELAIRAALGAGTAALRRTLLAESLLLCGAGAALGVVIAEPMLTILARYAARFSVRALELTVDSSMLWVGAGLAGLAAVVLAFVPRLPSADTSHGFGLTSASLRLTGSTTRRQRVFAVTQIAASFVLLAGASMLLTTLLSLQAAQSGFDTRRVLALNVPVMSYGRTPEQIQNFYQESIRRIGELPGVDQVAAGTMVPWRDAGNFGPGFQFSADGHVNAPGEEDPRARFRTISPGFFTALGVPIIAGRDFTDADRNSAERVVIVSQTLAQRMFPNMDAINRHVWWTDPVIKFVDISPAPRRIVGISADVDDENIVPGPALTVFHPFAQGQLFAGRLFVHTRSDPYALVQPVTRIIRSLSADQPVERAATLEDVRAEVLTPDRLNALVFGGFAAVALAIAVVGVAGVLAFSVSGRTREFGIRLAIGSQPRHLLTGVLAEGALMAAVGVLTGAACGYVMARLAGSYFGSVRMPGVIPIAGSAVVLLSAALVASVLPAARAARVDVMQALRSD
jgi:predicted permease